MKNFLVKSRCDTQERIEENQAQRLKEKTNAIGPLRFVPSFLKKKIQGLSRTHIPFFKHSIQWKKSLESGFFSSSTSSHQEQFYPEGRSVFSPLRLFRTVWVGITLACTEITGLSSTDCNSQGLSRCVQTLALLQLVKLGTLRSDNGDANERSLKNRLRSLSNFLAPIPSHLVT